MAAKPEHSRTQVVAIKVDPMMLFLIVCTAMIFFFSLSLIMLSIHSLLPMELTPIVV
jgi:hypothetical protein